MKFSSVKTNQRAQTLSGMNKNAVMPLSSKGSITRYVVAQGALGIEVLLHQTPLSPKLWSKTVQVPIYVLDGSSETTKSYNSIPHVKVCT